MIQKKIWRATKQERAFLTRYILHKFIIFICLYYFAEMVSLKWSTWSHVNMASLSSNLPSRLSCKADASHQEGPILHTRTRHSNLVSLDLGGRQAALRIAWAVTGLAIRVPCPRPVQWLPKCPPTKRLVVINVLDDARAYKEIMDFKDKVG